MSMDSRRAGADQEPRRLPPDGARDSVNAKVMKDPRLADMMDPKKLPFDGMRMFWGGFKNLVEL
jgi:uncharacterized protein YbaA (DUF1428 family)